MSIQAERLKTLLVGLLLLITVLAVIVQSTLLNKVLVIDAKTPYAYDAVDDRDDGGASTAKIEVINNKLILHCDIVKNHLEWPYCSISFNFVKRGTTEGLDLSQYTYAKAWVKYDKPQPIGIRFEIRNFDPSYSHAGEDNSLKYNGLEYYEKNTPYPAIIPLQNLQVLTWWLLEKEVPIQKMGREYNNAHSLDIATGNGVKPGKYDIIIERIEFVGKYVSDKNLYLFLLAIWGLFALGYFINRMHFIKVKLRESGHRQHELEALNRLLNVQQKTLKEKLSRDPLTGVLNRDGIANLFEGKNANRQNLSIIFMDIDHFKKINDSYGHNIGDQVLIHFARAISENTREMDLLARWGGEEFILACPNTDLAHAVQLAEKLRRSITEHVWPENISLTASFGVAEMYNEAPAEFIGRADRALYEAKEKGRNCVVIAASKNTK